MAEAREPESGTRETILQLIIERGPVTAANLAKILYLTPAAVRRHIGVLEEDGLIDVHETLPATQARRGRPARHYVATLEGQSVLKNQYSAIANDALGFIRDELGSEKIEAFANRRVEAFEQRYAAELDRAGDDPTTRAQVLVKKLSDDGYAASLRAVGPRGFALQLCQGHCPVQQVAGEFPELCEAETQAFSRLLGVHVQRLATLASGDHVCTTHIPLLIPSRPAGTPSRENATEGNQ
ncbi:helix-turn-helix transcriptional regulator [Flaviflexus equikiangi]|uniref:Winged helix-turn-helix transcriptional regulator n=1 Tax=Flaviflexus equikiangi TaxID=2758573 RepID=A0ABS2TFB7_9ACTO|nr:helix-turn-helix domain-containing protein [Flaviflexus equikiangi]MBM9433345.1 winged helix-turn-helix transcriptional regulator [Flaviflexus equikiangi]